MPSMFISFSPINRRLNRPHCSLFTPLASSYTTKQLFAPQPKSLQQQFGQQRRATLFQQFIVCSPLVCCSNRLQSNGSEEDTLLSKSPQTDTADVVSLADISLDIFEIDCDHNDSMTSTLDLSGEQMSEAPHPKGNDNEDHLIEEWMKGTGIRTRKRFQPSPKYDNVWEDITPPSAAAKTRHLAIKAKAERCSEQRLSVEQSLLKTPTGIAGKVNHVPSATTKKRVVSLSSKPAVATSKHYSSQNNSKTKRNTRVDTPITPTDVDVLFGRGGRTNIHNAKFREEVTKFVNRYHQVSRYEKMKVSTEIVNSVKGNGGRFLALDKLGSWYEVDDKKAIVKTSQGEYRISYQYLFKNIR